MIHKNIKEHAEFNLFTSVYNFFFLQAGKFDIIPTLTAIGSGVGIFGVVSLTENIHSVYYIIQRDIPGL